MSDSFASTAMISELRSVIGTYVIGRNDDNNTAAPGNLLNSLLGVEPNNRPNADLAMKMIELKFHGGGWTPITLMHFDPRERPARKTKTTPRVRGVMREIIDTHGYIHAGRPRAFRHMIRGNKLTGRGFRVVVEADLVVVRHHDTFVCSWYLDDIITRLATKLNHVAFVSGTRVGRKISFDKLTNFWGFRPSVVADLIVSGVISLDFDARRKDGSDAIRNHGVKFRIKKVDLHRLFQHSS